MMTGNPIPAVMGNKQSQFRDHEKRIDRIERECANSPIVSEMAIIAAKKSH